MHAFREKSIGLLIYGGCGTALLCGFGSWFLTVGLGISGLRFGADNPRMNSLMYLGIFITMAGAIAGAAGIALGILASRSEFSGKRLLVSNARVLARYAVDRDGVMYTEDFTVEQLDKPKYLVRLEVPGMENLEYQCAEQVYWQAGEGMRGEAEIQGKWLGSFRPYFGDDQGYQDDRVPRL